MQRSRSVRLGRVLVLSALGALCACAAYQGTDVEYFTPSARVYFDTGEDEDDEVDLYKDGSLNAAVDFVALTFPWSVKDSRTSRAQADAIAAEADMAAGEANAVEQAQAAVRAAAADVVAQEAQVAVKQAELQAAEATKRVKEAAKSGEDAVRKAATETEMANKLVAVELARAKAQEKLEEAEEAHRAAAPLKLRDSNIRHRQFEGEWTLGPRLAIGLTGPADDSDDGTVEASGTPVVYATLSMVFDCYLSGDLHDPLPDTNRLRFEAGYMYGVTADESFGDTDDSAIFVGVTFLIH